MGNLQSIESVISRTEQIKQEIRDLEKQIRRLKDERRNLKLPEITKAEANQLYWEGNLPLALIMAAAGLKNNHTAQKALIRPKEFPAGCGQCKKETSVYAASRSRAAQLSVESRKGTYRCADCSRERIEAETAAEDAIRRIRTAQSQRIFELETMPYQEYLKTPHWQAKRKEKLAHARYSCELCSATNARLNIHHKHYQTRGCETNRDLIALCESCHAKFHGKLPGEQS